MDKPSEIRGLMITVTNGRVLLPNANVTEIITYSMPEAIENAPNWLLGRTLWKVYQANLDGDNRMVFNTVDVTAGWTRSTLNKGQFPTAGDRQRVNAKVTVLKALGGNPKMPFLAMVAQGFPRLTTISSETLITTGEDDARPAGIAHTVLIRDDQAIVPDLVGIERLISDAIAA